jgi:hypothetical protein
MPALIFNLPLYQLSNLGTAAREPFHDTGLKTRHLRDYLAGR